MKHSTINAKAKNSRKVANIGSRAAAAVFWIVLWQFAAMGLGQEILLASPVSVIRRLGELVLLPEFWQSIWFSFGRIAITSSYITWSAWFDNIWNIDSIDFHKGIYHVKDAVSMTSTKVVYT